MNILMVQRKFLLRNYNVELLNKLLYFQKFEFILKFRQNENLSKRKFRYVSDLINVKIRDSVSSVAYCEYFVF